MLYGTLLLLSLLLLPLLGHGQTRPGQPAAPDSATAIRQLFWLRRQQGPGLAVGCGAVAPGTDAPALATSQLMLPPGAVAGLGTNCSLLTFFGRLRFSVRREQAALRCLAAHRPLPGYVQRAVGPLLASK